MQCPRPLLCSTALPSADRPEIRVPPVRACTSVSRRWALLALVTGVLAAGTSAVAAPPTTTVGFTFDPAQPIAGRAVTFTSTSTVSGNNEIRREEWDLDGDGVFGDRVGREVTWLYPSAGTRTVGLRVVDKHEGHVHTLSRSLTVLPARPVPTNDPPIASFAYYPSAPAPGELVTFHSTSTDHDSPIVEQLWELDGDGDFNDAAGPSASRRFDNAGTYVVGLRVRDSANATSSVSATVTVELPRIDAAPVSAAVGSSPPPTLLTPFPVVRLAGAIVPRGLRVRRLTVGTPPESKLLVRCRGRRCPFHRIRRSGLAGPARVIRLRRIEGRLLVAGTRLEVFVTGVGSIGKYTRFDVRPGKPPRRIDRCLLSESRRPRGC
jgi:PKD repeat protein